MKSVLISIRPEWCEKIASGEKTVEIRKTAPKLEPPFKVLIYCTKNTKKNALHTYIRSGYGRKEFGIIEQWRSGKEVVDVNAHLPAYRYNAYLAEGKVIGEFVCDEIIRFYKDTCDHPELDGCPVEEWLMWDASEELLEQIGTDKEDIEKCTCLTEEQILMYTQGDGYGWHISDLVIYEKPRPLSAFYKCGAETLEELSDREELCQYCSDTGYGEYATYGSPNGPVMCEGRFCDKAYQEYLDENFALTRPPQSWCYVEDEVMNTELDKKWFYENLKPFANKHLPIHFDIPINRENLRFRIIFSWSNRKPNGDFNPIMYAQLVDTYKQGPKKYVVPDLVVNAIEAGLFTDYKLYKYLAKWIENGLAEYNMEVKE